MGAEDELLVRKRIACSLTCPVNLFPMSVWHAKRIVPEFRYGTVRSNCSSQSLASSGSASSR